MNTKKLFGGRLSWGTDTVAGIHVTYSEPATYKVINYTSAYFAVGASTSGGLGLWASPAVKRGGEKEGETHRSFRGCLIQFGVYWFKLYLYLYFNGDGLT